MSKASDRIEKTIAKYGFASVAVEDYEPGTFLLCPISILDQDITQRLLNILSIEVPSAHFFFQR